MKTEKYIIKSNVKPGEEVWTGIPGKYEYAPEEEGVYQLVEYFYEDEQGRRIHDSFAFESCQEVI